MALLGDLGDLGGLFILLAAADQREQCWVAPFFFKDMTASTSMTMRRERFGTSTVP